MHRDEKCFGDASRFRRTVGVGEQFDAILVDRCGFAGAEFFTVGRSHLVDRREKASHDAILSKIAARPCPPPMHMASSMPPSTG